MQLITQYQKEHKDIRFSPYEMLNNYDLGGFIPFLCKVGLKLKVLYVVENLQLFHHKS